MKKNIITVGILILFSVIGLYETTNFTTLSSEGDIGLAFWPRVLLILLIILSMILLFKAIFFDKNNVYKNDSKDKNKNMLWKVLAGMTSIFIFYFIFEWLGFIPATFLLYCGLSLIMSNNINVKTISITIGKAIILIVIIFAIFDLMLNVDLPYGFYL
jgi:hypothetical protein